MPPIAMPTKKQNLSWAKANTVDYTAASKAAAGRTHFMDEPDPFADVPEETRELLRAALEALEEC
jgi:hypothetical protein